MGGEGVRVGGGLYIYRDYLGHFFQISTKIRRREGGGGQKKYGRPWKDIGLLGQYTVKGEVLLLYIYTQYNSAVRQNSSAVGFYTAIRPCNHTVHSYTQV